MLFDAVDFEFVRNDPGVGSEMDKLEAQYGPLDKKMMIQEGDIPAELQDDIDPKRKVLVFESSFDDVNAGFGIAFYSDTFEPATVAWVRFDDENDKSQFPTENHMELMMGVLTNQHVEQRLGTPMYTFYNNQQVFTVAGEN